MEDLFERMEIAVVGGSTNLHSDNKDNNSDIDDDEEGSDGELNQSFVDDNKISQKHQKFTSLEERAKEDMDFPDEVDTPLDEEARKRYIQYRGIKSLKNCDWDPYENLPSEYSKIWRFQNYHQAHKDSIQQVIDEGLPINGTYIRLTLVVESQN